MALSKKDCLERKRLTVFETFLKNLLFSWSNYFECQTKYLVLYAFVNQDSKLLKL